MNTPQELEELRSAYRSTFREWSAQIDRLGKVPHSAEASPARIAAENQTIAAEASYREARNRLAEGIAPASETEAQVC